MAPLAVCGSASQRFFPAPESSASGMDCSPVLYVSVASGLRRRGLPRKAFLFCMVTRLSLAEILALAMGFGSAIRNVFGLCPRAVRSTRGGKPRFFSGRNEKSTKRTVSWIRSIQGVVSRMPVLRWFMHGV